MDKINKFILMNKKLNELVETGNKLTDIWLNIALSDNNAQKQFDADIHKLINTIQEAIHTEKLLIRERCFYNTID